MDHLDTLHRAITATRGVIAGVKPDDMDAATPCTEWTVRDVLNHLVGTLDLFAAAAAGDPSTGFDPFSRAPDLVGAQPVSAYDAAAQRCLAAWRARGDLEGSMRLVGEHEAPAALAWQITVGDVLVHGWDIARATGQPFPVDDDVTATMWARMNGALPDAARGEGKAFGPAVDAPDDASDLDRIVAYTGRTP